MFVQVIQGQVADRDELRAAADRWLTELQPGSIGWLGTTSGVTADGQAIIMARFESEEAARRNSERPEQNQWWMETAKLFAGDVEFHDCREVYTMGAGGSDRAGFVQVIQGRITDAAKARSMMDGLEDMLRDVRPDVLGGLVCVHADGSGDFTQVVYFTSEAEAREGERKMASGEARRRMEEQMSIMTDVRYYDLATFWLDSPK
jgi:hypothetical protein